jgi:hypothetical protein
MPTLAELVKGVYRDLADEAEAVFSTLQVEDFVRAGIADLNRVAPNEGVEEIALTVDPDTGIPTVFSYDIGIHLPYKVEIVRNADGYSWSLSDPGDDGGMEQSGGYNFFATAGGGTIEFPKWWLEAFPAGTHTIRVLGYMERPLPVTIEGQASPETGLSGTEEYSVRASAKSQGFDLLAHDRSLFAQWQGQTNNTDVSPTQITQMAQGAKSEWDRQRGLIRVVRRSW